jgi:hypothetical protein
MPDKGDGVSVLQPPIDHMENQFDDRAAMMPSVAVIGPARNNLISRMVSHDVCLPTAVLFDAWA